MATFKALYRAAEAGSELGLSTGEIRRLVEQGILERRYIGKGTRNYRITGDSMAAYYESLSESA